MYPILGASLVTYSLWYSSELQFLAHLVAFGLTVFVDALRITEEIFWRSM
jgi:hypothetical protein